MQAYHFAWLSVHPERTAEWLKQQLSDGFHIHHVDGDHDNNCPRNLLLIDGVDHIRLHGSDLLKGVADWRRRKSCRQKTADEDGKAAYEGRSAFAGSWAKYASVHYKGEKPDDVSWADLGARLSQKARKYAGRHDLPWPPSIA